MNMSVRSFVALGCMLCLSMASAHAQEPQAEPVKTHEWSVSYGVVQRHDDANTGSTPLGPALESRWMLQRHASWGVIGLEHLRAHRSGRDDQALRIDAYPRLWAGAYGNFALQTATNSSASSSSGAWASKVWRAEVFQAMEGAWEVSAGWDQLSFDRRVRMASLGVGRYVGHQYWRARLLRTQTSDGVNGWGARLMARHYYRGDADSFLELNTSYATQGRFDDVAASVDGAGRSQVLGWIWQHPLNATWAVKTQMSWLKNRAPANLRHSREAGLAVSARW